MKAIFESGGAYHQTRATVEIPMVPLPNVPFCLGNNQIRLVIRGRPKRWVGQNLLIDWADEVTIKGETVPLFRVRFAPKLPI